LEGLPEMAGLFSFMRIVFNAITMGIDTIYNWKAAQ